MESVKNIKLGGISVQTTEIEIEEPVYRQALADEMLDHELDAYLSDMDSETVVVDPEGAVINPYGGSEDLMGIVRPVLDRLPTWQLEQYVATRRAEEE